MELSKVLMTNYLPYAKGVIIGRALPAIDGLKPSQRRILYCMYTKKLLTSDRTKSTNIVGATMQWHPHGDGTIYDTLVRMSKGHAALNVPYIDSKGNFGKVYSKDLAFAASRYTEAKLADICNEMFDGINENAVDFQPNYDDSLTEPVLLPVKFPTILANPSNGIAVGSGSSIPAFGLRNVCKAVIGKCDGSIKDIVDLVNILGIPEFTTGGNVHTTRDEMVQLAKTGHGTIVMTGTAITYSDRIEIVEVPYRSSVESIIEAVEEGIKAGTMREFLDISDDIDLKNGLKLTIPLRRGTNPQAALRKLIAMTPFCSTVSFNTRVIFDDKCETLGIDELLEKWIEFRMRTIRRIYEFRCNKISKKVHLLEAWEKIQNDIKAVVSVIVDTKDTDKAKQILSDRYGLDNEQAEFILDMKVRALNSANVNKNLRDLAEQRAELANCKFVVESDEAKKKIIIEDQKRIIDKYAKGKNKTHIAAPIVPESKEKQEESIDDSYVAIAISKSGYMKRLISLRDLSSFEFPENEEEMMRISMKNNEHLLVFTYDGSVYKILANDIDAGRGKLRDNVGEMIGVPMKQIMFIDAAGDYSKHFNLVYKNGRGVRVYYNRAQGKRSKYRSLFEASNPGELWWTFEDEFFMVTHRRKAAYCNLKLLGAMGNRAAFKVARVSTGDSIFALQETSKVPDMTSIDISKYNKGYTVSIGEDELWEGAREKYLKQLEAKEAARELARQKAREAKLEDKKRKSKDQ